MTDFQDAGKAARADGAETVVRGRWRGEDPAEETVVRGTWRFDAGHALFADHFPGAPRVPGTLLIEVASFDPSYDSVYDCMDRAREFLPAHMAVEFEFGGPDWTAWDAQDLTWTQLDAQDLTWQQRDTGEAPAAS